MRVFITGATGFIGSHVKRELIGAGHEVAGLARSDDVATALAVMGAAAHRGSLEDGDCLPSGASEADAVIYLGFNNDSSKFQEVCAIDQAAIKTLGAALAGSGKPLIVPNGLAGLARPGQTVTEADVIPDGYPVSPYAAWHCTRWTPAGGGVKPLGFQNETLPLVSTQVRARVRAQARCATSLMRSGLLSQLRDGSSAGARHVPRPRRSVQVVCGFRHRRRVARSVQFKPAPDAIIHVL